MIQAESKGGERTLRSASPHRNAYKSDFHAIKCSFDGTKSEGAAKSYANGSSDTREDSRGRPFGTRVNKIKNIFLQMDGQQLECQDVKVPSKTDVSPPKLQFPVNTHRANFSPTSPESLNLDKTPKGEDVEIDKVALAEKFSVTRKLFERAVTEQPVVEKQSSNRVATRLSLGNASDEGKSPRKSLGSSETPIKSEKSPASAVKCGLDENADHEKRHVSRVSLNAGPISKRLENYMTGTDAIDNKAAAKGGMVSASLDSSTEHSLPTSPTRSNLHKPTSPVKEATNSSPVADATNRTTLQTNKAASSGSGVGLKPTFPATNAAYKSVSPTTDSPKSLSPEQTPPCNYSYKRSAPSSEGLNRTSVGGDEGKPCSPSPRDVKQHVPSSAAFQNTNRVRYSEKTTSKDTMVQSPTRDNTPSQTTSLASKGVGTVRAELVVVQNESSESEENEDERVTDNVFEGQTAQRAKDQPTDLKKTSPHEKQNCGLPSHVIASRKAETVGEGIVLEDDEPLELKSKEDSLVSQDDSRNYEGEEVPEDESELEEQGLQSAVDGSSPVVYGIENAAFVDDKDVDQVFMEDEEDEETEGEYQIYRENDDYYEAPGLSDEEGPPPKRKIKFSTDPILVRILFLP